MKTTSRGFSLLEAIVALAILSSSGVALYAWLSTSLSGLIRVDEVMEMNQVTDDLDAFFSTLNLTDESEQRLKLNGYDVDWRATLVEPKQQGRSLSGQLSHFDLGLYEVDVEVYKGNKLLGDYTTRIVGYQRTRGPNAVMQ